MGEAIDRLRSLVGDETVALSGAERVGAYTRHTKTGKSVHVDAYTRSPGDMSTQDIEQELGRLTSTHAGMHDLSAAQKRNRLVALRREYAARQRMKSKKFGEAFTEEEMVQREKARARGEDPDAADFPAWDDVPDPENPGYVKAKPKPSDEELLTMHHKNITDHPVDDYGKAALKKYDDETLDALIAARERANSKGKHGMSGAMDLKIMQAERRRRHGY